MRNTKSLQILLKDPLFMEIIDIVSNFREVSCPRKLDCFKHSSTNRINIQPIIVNEESWTNESLRNPI